MKPCHFCQTAKAIVKIPSTLTPACKECFYSFIETNVHNTIMDHALFKPGDKVAIAASGGKDSTVLAHIMCLLNKKYNYGLDLCLLSIDEGITGYRDDSLQVNYIFISCIQLEFLFTDCHEK